MDQIKRTIFEFFETLEVAYSIKTSQRKSPIIDTTFLLFEGNTNPFIEHSSVQCGREYVYIIITLQDSDFGSFLQFENSLSVLLQQKAETVLSRETIPPNNALFSSIVFKQENQRKINANEIFDETVLRNLTFGVFAETSLSFDEGIELFSLISLHCALLSSNGSSSFTYFVSFSNASDNIINKYENSHKDYHSLTFDFSHIIQSSGDTSVVLEQYAFKDFVVHLGLFPYNTETTKENNEVIQSKENGNAKEPKASKEGKKSFETEERKEKRENYENKDNGENTLKEIQLIVFTNNTPKYPNDEIALTFASIFRSLPLSVYGIEITEHATETLFSHVVEVKKANRDFPSILFVFANIIFFNESDANTLHTNIRNSLLKLIEDSSKSTRVFCKAKDEFLRSSFCEVSSSLRNIVSSTNNKAFQQQCLDEFGVTSVEELEIEMENAFESIFQTEAELETDTETHAKRRKIEE